MVEAGVVVTGGQPTSTYCLCACCTVVRPLGAAGLGRRRDECVRCVGHRARRTDVRPNDRRAESGDDLDLHPTAPASGDTRRRAPQSRQTNTSSLSQSESVARSERHVRALADQQNDTDRPQRGAQPERMKGDRNETRSRQRDQAAPAARGAVGSSVSCVSCSRAMKSSRSSTSSRRRWATRRRFVMVATSSICS
jgi:hypothetical protein